jgi:hypothetical protein
MVLLPLANHSLEFFVHWMRGTPKLVPSIVASVIFTALSTLFNLYAMRRGALIVGSGRKSLGEDLLRMPGLLVGFVTLVPNHLVKFVAPNFLRKPRKLRERKPVAR